MTDDEIKEAAISKPQPKGTAGDVDGHQEKCDCSLPSRQLPNYNVNVKIENEEEYREVMRRWGRFHLN
jgi:hypothetical protein